MNGDRGPVTPPLDAGAGSRAGERSAAVTAVALAALVVLPLVPGALSAGDPAQLVGVPVESIVVVLAVGGLASALGQGLAAAAYAAVIVAALLVAALDVAFRASIDRPFSAAEDGIALVNAFGVVEDALGSVGAWSVLIVVIAVLVGCGAVLAAAALRVGRVTAGAGSRGRMLVAAVALGWIAFAAVGAQFAGASAAASRSLDALVTTSARAIADVEALRAFDRSVAADRLAAQPGEELLTALAGKDVVIAFVESYGRIAVEPSDFTRGIERTLDDGAAMLDRRGYVAQSAFLASPTFGGVSWLAHATLQSGVWVDSQQKYGRLMTTDRLTLTSAFEEAGWQTAAVVPSNRRFWEEGQSFYGFDTVLDSRNMGYEGPAFGYARMPDQYTWSTFHDRVLAPATTPVMAEVDLVSSHAPWTPLPRLLPWDELGDGSVFAAQAEGGQPAVAALTDAARAQALYAASVEYSLGATFSYLGEFEQRDLVLVLVGDHQPARRVSGTDAPYDVPVTIIASDPDVFERIASWGWEDGVHPSAGAPVWRMDEFRDRFVDAFSG